MLCHKYKCIFVHIPKVAGQSVEHVFVNLLGLTWETRSSLLLKHNDDPKLGPPRLAHLTAKEYLTHGYVTEEQFSTYFKFSFVRNPWARLVSEYNARYSSTYEFKRWLFEYFPKLGWSDEYRHIIPQYDFLYDNNQNCLVDFIGKFERLQEDFGDVCNKIGIEYTKLPHVNKSARKNMIKNLLPNLKNFIYYGGNKIYNDYREYFDSESCEFVELLYGKDINNFGYEFEK